MSTSAARSTDTAVTVVLFLIQIALWAVAFMSFIAIPMSTDNCAYVTCGDQGWIDDAMWTAAGSIPVGMLFIALGIYLLAQRRFAWWAALSGCAVQVLMLGGAWFMADAAGPLS